MGGGAADGHDARGVPPVRRYPDIHAQRLLVVFHLGGSAAMLLSQPSVAAADRAPVSLIQRSDRRPNDPELAPRPAAATAYLCPGRPVAACAGSDARARGLRPPQR